MGKIIHFIKSISVAWQVWKAQNLSRPPMYVVGDSWTNLIGVNVGPPVDLVDWMRQFGMNVVDAGIPGYMISSERKRKLYEVILRFNRDPQPLFFVSLGGNDLLDDPARLITDMEAVVGDTVNSLTSLLMGMYLGSGEQADIVVHGYDYVRADVDVPFYEGILMDRFGEFGLSADQVNDLTRRAIDLYNERLKFLADHLPYVHYIDLRSTLPSKSRWWESIHPSPIGHKLLVIRLLTAMLENSRFWRHIL